nr:transglutaminase domain-containing protein [uncultured Holophaga sp.]
MRPRRWPDHLPPWISLTALVATGLFSFTECCAMGVPLLLAAVCQRARIGLGSWRRPLELLAVAILLALILARAGLLLSLVLLIHVLCGIRLALPRGTAQRRQVLLMAFLSFLVAAMGLPAADFALWGLLWAAAAATTLADQAWEAPGGHLPLRPILAWTVGTALLAGLCFVSLPRADSPSGTGMWTLRRLGGSLAFPESLELSGRGPIRGQEATVLRVVPSSPDASARKHTSEHLALLRGRTLETFSEGRWEVWPGTPARRGLRRVPPDSPSPGELEFRLEPTADGLIPLPYGLLTLRSPHGRPLGPQAGGAMGWELLPRRASSLAVLMEGEALEREELSAGRRALLTRTDSSADPARLWSLRVAPDPQAPRSLARALEAELRTYTYTLDNPSGTATDPMRDFLERSRAGHCEYFASAMAAALRTRRVPARVVLGYRLGPWIAGPDYWLVSQREAHAWVEFHDDATQMWVVADPTPLGAEETGSALSGWLRLVRDALSFHWDRYVVRFSGEDQVAGLRMVQSLAMDMGVFGTRHAAVLSASGLILLLLGGLMLWVWRLRTSAFGGIPELAPLLQRVQRVCPPAPGETLRDWLERLGERYPACRDELQALADQVEDAVYGSSDRESLLKAVRHTTRNLSGKAVPPKDNRG